MHSYDRLVKLVHEVRVDLMKAEKGNQQAGNRARRIAREIKKASIGFWKDLHKLRKGELDE